MTVRQAEQQTYRQLAGMQAVLDRAESDSLHYSFREEILAVVASLPKAEREHWVRQYCDALRAAIRAPDVTLELSVRVSTALAELLVRTCRERGIDPDSAVCEAITQWCKEKQS